MQRTYRVCQGIAVPDAKTSYLQQMGIIITSVWLPQAEDYIGLKGSFDDHIGLLVRGEDGGQKTAIQPDPRGLPSLPPNLEARLPQLDQSLRITHAEWLPVTKTRCVHRLIAAA